MLGVDAAAAAATTANGNAIGPVNEAMMMMVWLLMMEEEVSLFVCLLCSVGVCGPVCVIFMSVCELCASCNICEKCLSLFPNMLRTAVFS